MMEQHSGLEGEQTKLQRILKQAFLKEALFGCTLSKVRDKQSQLRRVTIRPVLIRDVLHYQATYDYSDRVTHENAAAEETKKLILKLLQTDFRQGILLTPEADWQILVSKKGRLHILRQPPSGRKANLAHNRAKNYILKEGRPYPFLLELGVMDAAGKVLAKRYNKFRQLNRFLEIVRDCLPHLAEQSRKAPLTIVDFGSGKAYLTFALYHYLVEQRGMAVRLIGLDLKEDVVAFCRRTADNLGWDMEFLHQDIRDFSGVDGADLVVSLHACDVATDYALAQAVRWQTRVILAVPCCQHELFGQIVQPGQGPLLEHGILKERVAALITDAARAKLLEIAGYSVQVMEFVDLEHTPKNLLIRALRGSRPNRNSSEREYREFKEYWQIEPTLESLLGEEDEYSELS